MEISFHKNAAAMIVAAAEASGLLRQVANALRQNMEIAFADDRQNSSLTCLACGWGGVLEELAENFGEYCSLPGYDFYGEGFCVTEYSDNELTLFLRLPYELPQNEIEMVAVLKKRRAEEIAKAVAEAMKPASAEKMLAEMDSEANPKRGSSGWTQDAEGPDAA
jgi:hypothetical protein